MDFSLSPAQEAIRQEVAEICSDYSDDYWRELDRRGEYPEAFRLLGADVLIAENLASLSALGGQRVTAYAFPLFVRGGDSGHARIVLEVDK